METVEDEHGRRYVRLKRSAETSLVHDPDRDEVAYLPNDRLNVVDGERPLAVAARAIPSPVRALIAAVPSERALGLLVVLDERDRLDVRTILDRTAYCESDLYATLRGLASAGLIQRSSDGDDGTWTLTALGQEALDAVRQS